ncbi:YrrS family protein [Salipaludibacillus sp. CUR1]|uniref:YrrS family protein n=1 Tax=Salipaludibacillus sp. CUR1 TaxID=2820003 RepID=UPI001E5F08E7|nr:YrrS family protein [Salipaludibacillus sp. CUR1]MCE7790913.1 YrrS family protein [Salipaludibacillus sp. CUR1]
MSNNYPPMRSDNKKKRRLNTILNVSIGLVALLIIFVSATLIFGGGDDNEVAVTNNNDLNNEEENTNSGDISIDQPGNEENDNENNTLNDNNENDEVNDGNNTNESNNNEESNTEDSADNANNEGNLNNEDDNNEGNEDNAENEANEAEEGNEETETNEENTTESDGEWGPVGTVQEEPFTPVYQTDHVNWEEMTRALSHATGLSEDEMEVWQIRNGGNQHTAIGTVSTYDNRFEPYKVELNWVENEGWMPVSVEEQSSNPYVSR